MRKTLLSLALFAGVLLFFACERTNGNIEPKTTSNMFVGLWEQTSGCPCNNGSDICFYPDGKMFLSQTCDSSYYYSFERDTLWIQGERPAIAQFDTSSDGTIIMTLRAKLPLCREPGEGDNGWFNYTYVKKSGLISIVGNITSEDIQGAWVQQEECECSNYDTLHFSSDNLMYNTFEPLPREYSISGNILYETSSSGGTAEHPVKLALWPDGKKIIQIDRWNNYCNINCVLESVIYTFVQQ